MGHFIGRMRKRARRMAKPGARGNSGAVRAALQAGEVQAKLQVGPQNDAFEREADAVAARVVSNQPAGPVSTLTNTGSQRKCAACTEEEEQAQAKLRSDLQRQPEEEDEELQMKARDQVQRQAEEEEELQAKARDPLQRQVEEEEEDLQMKPLDRLQRQSEEEEEELQTKLRDPVQRQAEEEEEELQAKGRETGFSAGPQATAQVASLRGAGQPLGSGPRSFFESRFGADFSDVRVHTGPRAERAADRLNARAFTTGRDVVFGAGEYAPGTRKGTELLAHELTHVIQQRGYRGTPEAPDPVQRWRVGAAPAPTASDWDTVPDGTPAGQPNHRRRLAAARRIVSNLLSSTRCQNYFENNCEGGSPSSLRDAFNTARVYHMDVGGVRLGENQLGTPNIAYNNTAYNQGRFFLAATLLHEMYHVCSPTRPHNTRELLAENALEACRLYAPYLRRISPRSGPQGTTVTLTGWGLGPTQGAQDRVEFNGATCTVLSWSFDRSSSMVTIRVELPAGARTGHFRVFNNNVGSRPAAFTVT